jgi:guanidinoacetate N-methyltransferase
MTRKIHKSAQLEITLQIKDDEFISPPRVAQKNAILNRALKEFVSDLKALDNTAKQFVEGDTKTHLQDRTQTVMSDDEIMEDWQIPLMQAMANSITASKGDILEIGYGRGISAAMIQDRGVKSHTIIECNDDVVARYSQWKNTLPDSDIRLVHGLWQSTIDSLGLFDGIFFHTYPLDEDEYMTYVHGSTTFAEHFFAVASAHLCKGGTFTYMTNEIDSLSREHQRLIFQHFSSFTLQIVPLSMPSDVKDTWWADSMAVVKAIK